MSKLNAGVSFGLGGKTASEAVFSKNHYSSEKISPEVKAKIASMGLSRVAGNVWESPSTKDLWKVSGGKIIRLSGEEVDNGEKISAAPSNDPMSFISAIMDDLSF